MTGTRNVIIRASAGTGKTFQLSNRYLRLLIGGATVDEILATTFTRKAAAEILDRILKRLATAAADASACDELAGHLTIATLTQDRCAVVLRDVTRRLHRLRVGTIDSFFAKMAGGMSLELGLPPGWRMVEDLDDRILREEAIETILRDDAERSVTRIVQLMAKGDADRSVGEMVRGTVQRLYNLFVETAPEAWQRFPKVTLMSSEARKATIEALRSADLPDLASFTDARNADLEAAETGDWDRFLRKGLAKPVAAGGTKYRRREIPPEVVTLYQRLVGHARGTLIETLKQQTWATYQLLDRFHHVYSARKHASRGMRFEDITHRLANGASGMNADRMTFRLDARIRHVLLDEFQDTSVDQWRALTPLARQASGADPLGDGADHSLFCVGDVKQAIYGWRGGAAEVFDAVEQQLPDIETESLDISRRSSPAVIDVVNRTFENLTRHTNLGRAENGVVAWQNAFPRHDTVKKNMPGYVELAAAPEGDSQGDTTLEYAADRIRDLVASSLGVRIGVLVRTNVVVGKLVYELRRRGVAASEEGGNPLTDSAAVELILSLLKLADHPGDDVARQHVATSPLGPVVGLTSATDVAAACHMADTIRRALQIDGWGAALERWCASLIPQCHRRDRNRLRQLVELAYGYRSDGSWRADRFIRFVRESRVADVVEASVEVMTIHQAKGLEFDAVVLPELTANLVGQPPTCVVGRPSPIEPVDQVCLHRSVTIQALLPPDLQELFSETTDRAVTESLCLLYVAMTRAVHALYLVIAPSKANEKSMPCTFAGILRSALADGAIASPDTVLYRHGDATWATSLEGSKDVAARTPANEAPLILDLAPMTERQSGLDRMSPSRIAHGHETRVADCFQLTAAASRSRGTLVHAWFEQIAWLEQGQPDAALLRTMGRRSDATEEQIAAWMEEFQAMLSHPEVTRLLTCASYRLSESSVLADMLPPLSDAKSLQWNVHNECRFAVRRGGTLLEGVIDRLVLAAEGDRVVAADIVDFKTDQVNYSDPESLAQKIDTYRPQLASYQEAIADIYQIPATQISCRLLFVGPSDCKSVVVA